MENSKLKKKGTIKRKVNLTDYRSTIVSLNFDTNDWMKEENNDFGWNVAFAKIKADAESNELLEYSLFTKTNKQRAHCKKVMTTKLTYWKYEYIDRESFSSPDAFEPRVRTFLDFYYKKVIKRCAKYYQEIELPMVTYSLDAEGKLLNVNYSIAVENYQRRPLLNISFNKDSYITSISDFQTVEFKHIGFPTLQTDKMYLIQKHRKEGKSLRETERVNVINNKSIIFQGFKKHKMKYLCDEKVEKQFKKYGIFMNEIRGIMNDAEIMLSYIPTINYHLIKSCDMKCRHCFSDYSQIKKNKLQYKESIKIVKEILKIKSIKKINFSGGEPTLFKGIEKLIAFAKKNELETSLVTNGYRISKSMKLLNAITNNLDILALSLDSFKEESNKTIGRVVNNQTLTIDQVLLITKICKTKNVKIKINTVVTKYNYNQSLIGEIIKINPIRWKILRMLPVIGQNENANDIYPSDEEYNCFIRNNSDTEGKVKIVAEDNEDMTGSYLMIGPDGRFFNNIDGELKFSDEILKKGIRQVLREVPLMREIFYKREGDYSCYD